MARLDRFLRLEGIRPRRPERGRTPSRARFEDVGTPPRASRGTHGSGAELERFDEGPAPVEQETLRLREDDGGQPFIRCRHCRCDNAVSAARCRHCGADLATPAQRSFNTALWERHLAEEAELREETERLEAQRRRADEALARAMDEMARLRLRQHRWISNDPFVEVGRAIGSWLTRTYPDRRRRARVVVGAMLVPNLLLLWLVFGWWPAVVAWLVLVTVQAAVGYRIWRVGEARCRRS